MATGRYLLIAFSVQNENTDFKLDFSFQSWECFRRSLVRLTCADERDTDRKIQTQRVYERSECAVLGLNFVPRDCEAEARPADETAEAEQGQRSAFCKPAATGAAKAGNRNHQGEGISVPRMRAEMGSP